MENDVTDSPDSRSRFSDRVDNYVRWRPHYPPAMFDTFVREASLAAGDALADLGSGTGISTGPLLERGLVVHAVEPNDAMRAAADAVWGSHDRYHGTAGSAESTGLAPSSMSAAIAAQAFHWFDRDRLRQELHRILRPPGHFAVAWNARLTDATPFLRAYEDLLRQWGTDYAAVDHTQIPEDAIREVVPRDFRAFTFDNEQSFEAAGLEGRLLSSSYTPPPGHPDHEPMLRDLRAIFEQHSEDGKVRFLYETKLYIGRIAAA